MAFRQRTIIGTVVDGDGEPIENGQVRFKPTKPLAYTATHIVVDADFTVQTDTDGDFEIDIWCDEDSLVPVDYNVYFPTANGGQASNEHRTSFSLQYGDGSPINLAVLINASVPAPTEEELLYTLILELIAANGGGPPSGGAGGVLSGTYPDPGFAVNMAEQSELDAAVSALTSLINAKASSADITAAVAALVDSSPGALDTLNELAAALGDDPNFATTITNALAGKVPTTRTVNGAALSSNITLTQDEIGDGATYKQFSQTEKTKLANAVASDGASPTAIEMVWSGSQAQYDALTPDANTLYFIV